MAVATVTVKKCARCGRSLKDPRMRIYSRATGNYYCPGVNACSKRAVAKAKGLC